MNYSAIKYFDIANGEGVRSSLFVSGCRRNCPGCFNAEAFGFSAGDEFTLQVEDEIIASLEAPYVDGLTVLGGEPMEPENQLGLVDFLERVRAAQPSKTIWLYTGFVYETLTGELQPEDPAEARGCTDVTERLLANVDILVDGPYVDELHDITLRFRGSSNQRVIDLAKTRETGQLTLWQDDPVYATHSMS